MSDDKKVSPELLAELERKYPWLKEVQDMERTRAQEVIFEGRLKAEFARQEQMHLIMKEDRELN